MLKSKMLFEWMMKFNSNQRLFIWINWEEIACIPSFIDQRNYEHIFRFKNYPNEPIDSKYFLNAI